jgi:hypothetical protein
MFQVSVFTVLFVRVLVLRHFARGKKEGRQSPFLTDFAGPGRIFFFFHAPGLLAQGL